MFVQEGLSVYSGVLRQHLKRVVKRGQGSKAWKREYMKHLDPVMTGVKMQDCPKSDDPSEQKVNISFSPCRALLKLYMVKGN